MKLKRFRDRSLIMGTFLAAQSLQSWMKEELSADDSLGFLGALILLAIHFEDGKESVGPSRLSKTLGSSRSRVSQELSRLAKSGLVRRTISYGDARAVTVALTAAGERRAFELVKVFTRLQNLIDRALGEKNAEGVNASLLKLAEVLRA